MISNTGTAELKSFVDRIERLEEDKAAVLADIKELYIEVKEHGFTAAIVRKVVKARAMDAAKRIEEAELFDLYWGAVQGELFDDIPVTISAGDKSVKTTTGAMKRATAALKTPKGKRAAKKAVALARDDAAAKADFAPTEDEAAFA